MKVTEYEDLVDELNDKIHMSKEVKYFENNGLFFRFIYDGAYCAITLGDQILFYEDADREYDYENDKDIPIKTTVVKKFNEYVNALKTIKI